MSADAPHFNVAPESLTALSKQLASNPVWSNLKAVKNKQVYEVNPSFYIFGRGTRSLSLALDDAILNGIC